MIRLRKLFALASLLFFLSCVDVCVFAQDQVYIVVPIPRERPAKYHASPSYLRQLSLQKPAEKYKHRVDTTVLHSDKRKVSSSLDRNDFFEPTAKNILDMIEPSTN